MIEAVTGIKFNKTALTLWTGSEDYRQTGNLIMTVTPANATHKDVTYTSSAPAYLTVERDEDGNAVLTPTGKLPSKATNTTVTITARSTDGSNKTVTCKVTLRQRMETITIPVTAVITKGKTLTLKPVFNKGGNAPYNSAITWSSSDTSVATVSTSGVVTAKKAGTATITVRAADGGTESHCEVTVPAVQGIEWLGDSLTQGGLRSKNDNLANAPYVKLQKKLTANNEIVPVYGLGLWGKNTSEIFSEYRSKRTIDPNKVYVFWVGSNDWVLYDRIITDISDVADKTDSFLSKNGGVDKYIVIGTTSRYELDRKNEAWRTINAALKDHYGEHYLDIMDIIQTYGIGPDRTHLTQASYDKIAEAVYNKIKELNYLD